MRDTHREIFLAWARNYVSCERIVGQTGFIGDHDPSLFLMKVRTPSAVYIIELDVNVLAVRI